MESSSLPENSPSRRKRAIEELTQGHQFANRLRELLRRPATAVEPDPTSLDGIAGKILEHFDRAISIMDCLDSSEFSRTSAGDGRKLKESSESVETGTPTKVRRGCYRRRKESETFTKITCALIDDGHAWRKYGQKEILNAKHQRNYYRCSHKYDQGCQATKQVQKFEDEPPKYRITYNGHHSCRNLLKVPQTMDSSKSNNSSMFLNFETKGFIENKQVAPNFPSMEHENDIYSTSLIDNQSVVVKHHLSQDLITLDSHGPISMMSLGSEDEDVMSSGVFSSTGSTHGYEMNHILENTDFSDFPLEIYT